ncbi:ninjurin-2 [Caerostris darwini]|uniref:Ninjurin-2 n=1 Tax=Caerostris darwini TaxID=1538125 RepID=A0AAV4RHR1_9ARAC|nr:ninjurin-2 [Caerostris darwini]
MQWYELYPIKMNGGGENAGKTSQNLDANVYATKKTIAQGLLDVALLTANASQLKYLLQAGKEHEFYYVMMTLISLSIILQMSLGSVLIIKGRCDINDPNQQVKAEKLNNAAVCLVFISTVVHAFLSVFHITPQVQQPLSAFNQTATATTTTESSDQTSFLFVFSATFLCSQVLTGCMMLLIANTNLNEVKKQRRADNLNNAITIGIFLVAILNILIAALGIKNSDDLQAAVLSTLGTALQ